MNNSKLLDILNNFNIPETSFIISEVDQGNINQSYFIFCDNKPLYVLQKINTAVFSNIEALIFNFNYISKLLSHADKKTLTLISTKDNECFCRDGQNNVWRLCPFIRKSISFQETSKKEIAVEAGKLLGDFHFVCSKGDIRELKENVPEFHNTLRYYTALKDKVKQRQKEIFLEVSEIIDFISSREEDISFFEIAFKQGSITKKLVHNDTKLSNMLFNEQSLEGICLIDLDTVDRGLLPYDFGDSVRSICKKKIESEVLFDIDLFEEFVKGYFLKIDSRVLGNDYNYLFQGAKSVTLELLIRYLTDFISQGDYFKLDNKQDALRRAMMLQTLFLSMENNEEKALTIIKKYSGTKYE